jgi:hypothetical protein
MLMGFMNLDGSLNRWLGFVFVELATHIVRSIFSEFITKIINPQLSRCFGIFRVCGIGLIFNLSMNDKVIAHIKGEGQFCELSFYGHFSLLTS